MRYLWSLFLMFCLLVVTSGAPVVPPGTITVVVPPEEVIRESGLMVAKEVTGAVTIKLNGKTYAGYLTFPDTKVRRVGVKHMRVDQCIATGEIK